MTPRRSFHPTGRQHLEVFVDGRTTQAQVTGYLLDTEAFNQDFVTDDMNSLHAEHSFPPVAEVLAQPYRTEGPECSFSACQTVQFPISATSTYNSVFSFIHSPSLCLPHHALPRLTPHGRRS